MKVVKIVLVVMLVALVGIQFFPTTRNQSDIVPSTDFISTYNPPKEIEGILRTSCYDCHSNNTDYPWYNKIQPVSWFLESHIKEGKDELNFNEFASYSERRQKGKLKAILDEVAHDKMPLDSYTLIHTDAKLSENDKKAMDDWINLILKNYK
jgi:hypothetical protein